MTSIKNKIPLIVFIILTCVILFFTILDIMYEKQLLHLSNFISEEQILQRLLMLYGIFAVFTIVLIFSQMTKKHKAVLRSRMTFEKSLERKLHHFKCPKCNEILTVKKSKDSDNGSFITTCPCCGAIGKIPSKPKPSETKFKCITCGEQVSIWPEEKAKSSHDVVVYSCPYCGEKQSMKRT